MIIIDCFLKSLYLKKHFKSNCQRLLKGVDKQLRLYGQCINDSEDHLQNSPGDDSNVKYNI